MKIRYQLIIALITVGCAGIASTALIKSGNQPKQQDNNPALPVVTVTKIKQQSVRINVRSQGLVKAKTEIELKTDVSGRIIKISPSFVSGGFFKQGELLVTIDPVNYELLIAQARAKVMQAKHQLAKEQAEAEQARMAWKSSGKRKLSSFGFHVPQVADKQENLLAAQAELQYAKTKKQRTEIRAPFNGRVRSVETGLGGFVDEDSILGVIYSTDLAEVRLPVSIHDLAFLNISDARPVINLPDATLSAVYRGRQQTWQAKVVRSEGVINENTGMMMLVVQIPDPYQLNANNPAPPLPVGLFVEVVIEGQMLDDFFVLPSSIVMKNNQIAIVERDKRIAFRQVEVVHKDQDRLLISSGLTPDDQVLMSGLLHPVAGLLVALKNDTTDMNKITR